MKLQVIGDSYAARFHNFSQTNPELTGNLQSILIRSISGARVCDLKKFIKSNISVIQSHIPLLVFLGNNDFLANVEITVFKNTFLSFLRLLRRNYPGMVIVFTTLPLYPRIRNSLSAVNRLRQMNRFLLTLTSEFTKVIGLPDELDDVKYFHVYYGRSMRRDGIHFNNGAFSALVPEIERTISQFHS